MKAIILAAGRGVRMNPLSNNKPKCLFEVRGEPAILRQLRLLNDIGIEDIVTVVGFEAEQVREAVGKRAKYIYNPYYRDSSSIYSLWRSKEEMDDNLLILNSDIVYTREFLASLLEAAKTHLLICLPINTKQPFEEIDVGVQIEGNKVTRVDKNLPKEFCYAGSVDGLFVTRESLGRLKKVMNALLKVSLSEGGIYSLKNRLASEEPLDFRDVGNTCRDFDTVEEYKRVWELFG
ncbi:MAG: NTP transferase domain-containing protein [Deltaproteobacteria bacterium]|nr:NTP transferase domain-containing protein [Deltaproteobacteria bacterium]